MVPSSVAAAAADGIRSGRFGAGAGSTATLMAALSRLSELSTISTRELSRVEALLAGTLPHGALSLSEADLDGARRSAALMASSSSSEEFMDELSVFSSSASSAVSLASFRFDDAARLSDADMAALLRAISKDALCLALVNARGETAEAFFSRLSSGAERMLREDVAILSDISTGVSAEAAERVVDTARVLAGDGLISLPPPL
jgi:flagellar motor switch protein FliG